MSPSELFEEGRLTDALTAQDAVVAALPDDVAERLLLCDFLAFAGERAAIGAHLKLLSSGPAEIQEYLVEWAHLLRADDARHAGGGPEFLLEPPAHVASRLQALADLVAGQPGKALDLIDDADESAPCLEGFVDGREFEGWRDTDDLLGPVLEVFSDGHYFWLPVEQLRKLRLEPADELRDTFYRPATILLVDGRRLEVFIPALYVRSCTHGEDAIRIGAGIDWVEQDGLMRGWGARTLLLGEEELTLDEFRQIEVRKL